MSLVNPPQRTDEFVYHYTSCKSAIAILRSDTFRFSSLDQKNDPREACEWEPLIAVPPGSDLTPKKNKQLQHAVSRTLRRNTVISCFSLDDASCVDRQNVEAYGQRGFCIPPLWHNYADRHEGVCLVFNRDKFDTAVRSAFPPDTVHSGPVKYSDEGYLNRIEEGPFCISLVGVGSWDNADLALNQHRIKYCSDLFFQKRRDWCIEREYRWLCLSCVEPVRLIPISGAAVGIVFGFKVSRKNYGKLFQYCISRNLECATLAWRNGHPFLEDIMQPYITHAQAKRSLLRRMFGAR